MAKILVDINVLLDALLNRNETANELIDRLVESDHELFITASMVPILDYSLTKYGVDKGRFKEKFFSRFKIITTSGYDALKAIEYKDAEDVLIALSFKRSVGDGIIITSDKEFETNGLTILSPEDALIHFQTLETGSDRVIPMLDLKYAKMSANAKKVFDEMFDADKIYTQHAEHIERVVQLLKERVIQNEAIK